MAAKRRRTASSASRSSRSRSRTSSREPAERGLQADRDGKYPVTCPKCKAGYRVPEDYLDERITCKSCKSVFTPRTVLTKIRRPRKKDYTGLVTAGLGAILLVIAIIVINAVLGEEKKPVVSQPPVETLDMSHPAWLAWTRFCDAMSRKDQIGLLASLDVEAWYKKTAGKKAKPFERLDSAAIKTWEDEAVGALFRDDKWRMLREFEASSPNTFPETPKKLLDLSFESIMKPRKSEDWNGDGIVQVLMVKDKEGFWKVRSFETIKQARLKQIADPNRKVGYHKKLGKGKLETVKDSTGRTFKIRVIDPQPLEHLADTPAPLRKEIDKLLETLKDPNLPGRALINTRNRLEKIGAPAIPRILTQFYETRTKGLSGQALQDNLNFLNILTRILRTVTMHDGYGFAPARGEDGALGITDGERERALKGWFGWYSSYGWKMTNEDYEKRRKKAEEEDLGIEGWEEHKKRKKGQTKKK